MKSEVRIKRTLMYYDGPVVFIAEDNVGTNYLCQLFNRNHAEEKFCCVAVSSRKLSDLISGSIDLRSAYLEAENGVYFSLDLYQEDDSPLILEEIVGDLDYGMFPDEGLFLKNVFDVELSSQQSVRVLQDSIVKNTAVIELSLNPPESNSDHRIRLETLVNGLQLFSKAIHYAFKDSIKGLSRNLKNALKDPENYSVDAFATSPGSFRIHLQAKTQADAAGEVNISKALRQLDDIVCCVDDIDRSIEKLRSSNGHFVKVYREMLEYIITNNTPINYSWAVPSSRTSKQSTIQTSQAIPLYETLTRMKELETEQATFLGKIIRVNVPNGSWTIQQDDNRKISGRVHPESGLSLGGIVTETQKYRFECEERIEEEEYGRKHRYVYLLKSFAPI